MSSGIMTDSAYRRRVGLWLSITLAAFLSHSFWLCMVIVGTMLLHQRAREENPLALYAALIFAIPPISASIPGFGLVNYLFSLDYIRLLNICLLMPAGLLFYRSRKAQGSTARASDWLLASYIALSIALVLPVSTMTGTMRHAFTIIIDVWIPYYVASRLIRSIADFREIAAAYILAASALAVIAAFEFLRNWLLYSPLESALGVFWGYGSYLQRGEGGGLRALASTGHSIVLGYVLMVGISLLIFLQSTFVKKSTTLAFGFILSVGLMVTLSKGPWVGLVAALAVGLGIGPAAGTRLTKATMMVALAACALWISPWGEKFIGYLPFIGDVDEGSVAYRSQLFKASLIVIWQHPFLGSYDFIYNPALEQMRQGEGIIDIVNTYLGVALTSGLVGLALFVGPLLWAMTRVWRVWRTTLGRDPESDALGRALLAAMTGTLVTIATVSPINAIPTIVWFLAGICTSYARVFELETTSQSSSANRGSDGRLVHPRTN